MKRNRLTAATAAVALGIATAIAVAVPSTAADSPGEFTTFRPAGPNVVSTTGQWISSSAVGGLPANTPVDFDDIVAAVDGGDNAQLLAYGILVESGGTSTVASISWGGDTSFFTPEAEEEDDDEAGPAVPVEDEVTYAG